MHNQKLFNRNFTLVVIGQIISLFGNAILRFALPLYLLRETGSSALFGIVTACSFIPAILLSFVGGILADRVNKRNIMVVLDFGTSALVLALTLVLGKLPLVPLLIVTLMTLYGISGTYQPAVQASIPVLVSQENILPAGAVVNQIASLAGLLGPIIGGMLFARFGLTPILWISIACFALSAIMEIFIQIPHQKRTDQLGVLAIFRNDFQVSSHYLRHEKPVISRIVLLVSAVNLVISALLIVGLPVLVVNILRLDDQLLGFSQGILALGSLGGGICIGVFGKRFSPRDSHRILLGCSICLLLMAVPFLLSAVPMLSYFILTATSFGIMALATMFSIRMMAVIQSETPPELLGKLIALIIAVSMSTQPIGQAIYGVAFDLFAQHAGWVVLAAGIASTVIALVSKKIFRALAA